MSGVKRNNSSTKPLLGFLSAPAKVLFAVSAMLTLVGVYLTIEREVFPPGSYPIVILLLPGLALAAATFGIGCIVLKLLGISITARSSDDASRENNQPSDQK